MDIKLKDFEGPLDLLLHLVSKYQMDIYDVPITEVIEQYLAYVSTLQAMRKVDLYEIAKKLGLKTVLTLEKYR
ncbi:segregation and condensation protein A [Streptococcus pneumoniae]|nr:segregation and condensation protein A [Streptococcus pneumoniae]